MRILHTVEFYAPSKGGAQEVVRQLSERLVARGHDVTVACSAAERSGLDLHGVKVEGFQASGNLARGLQGDWRRYVDFVKQGRFDIILNYAAQQWATDALLDELPDIPGRKVLVPCGFSGLYERRYQRYFESMRGWLNDYNASVYLSESTRDTVFAREAGARGMQVIPNGADEREFSSPATGALRGKLGLGADEILVLSVGTHSGLKGHAQAMAAFRRSRLQKATLLIVAPGGGACALRCKIQARVSNWAQARAGKRIVVADLSREDTVEAFKSADIFLFLSMVECSPLVLFEACAAGTPFVASPAGNSAEIAAWTGGGVIVGAANDARGRVHADLADAVRQLERLASDADLRQRLGQAGQSAWAASYTWDKLARRYESLYEELLRPGSADR